MPSGSLKSLGKSSVGKSVGNASMNNAWQWLQNCKVTLTRLKKAQKEKHKRMYPFAKETFVSKKRRVKENKAKARKRPRERAEKNCERVFSAISHSSSYGEVITSDHCSVIGLNSLTTRDGTWLKLLRAIFWENRESHDTRQKSNFLLFCQNIPFSDLI